MNIADLVVILVVVAIVGGAVAILRRNKKNGKSSCGCDCGHCSQSCGKK
ncbi:MAG: FeoB-associated Cys-rich membrane protein, partial [Bariatricus sp.]